MELTNIDGTQLQLSDAMLDHCARAMYKIREPIGSTRVPFDHLSEGKKLTNRKVAREVLQTATRAWSLSSLQTDPNRIFDLVGDDLYRRMAPNKSQLNPWDGRSDFAKDYYRTKARTYLYDVLQPYAQPSTTSYRVEAPARRSHLGAGPADRAHVHIEQPGTQPMIVAGSKRTSGPHIESKIPHTAKSPITTNDVGTPKASSSPETKPDAVTGSQSLIAFLLVTIVVLLVVILFAVVT